MKKLLLLLLLPVVAFGQPVNPIISGGTGTGGEGSATNIGVSTSGGLLTTSTNGTGDFTIVLTPAVVGAVTSSNALYAVTATNAANAYGSSNVIFDVKRQDLYWFYSKIMSNKPVRVLAIGDSTTERSETFAGLRIALNNVMANGGYGTLYNDNPGPGIPSSGLIYYALKTLTAGSASYSPISYMTMTNGEVIDSVSSGIPADTLTIGWMPVSGTSLTVATNTGGGAYGTRFVIDTSSGSGYQVTNVSLTFATNYNWRVTSSGTNNLVDTGLTVRNQSTNYNTWAKAYISGGFVQDIVTNVNFYKFFTNYSPDLVICEDKAGGFNQRVLDAMDWTKNNMTNSSVIWVTPSPQAAPPEGGNADERNVMINWAITNNGIVFDKWARFIPTNYWGSPTFYEDAAHLSYGGRAYIQGPFVNFVGATSDRLAQSGIIQSVDVSGKANLAGGNVFTGSQIISGSTLQVGSTLTSTGSAAGFNFQDRATTDYGRLYANNNVIQLEHSIVGTYKYFSWSNNSGTLYVYADPVWGSRYLGTVAAPWIFTGNGSGITNLVYGPVVIAGSGVTVATNTTADTGVKSYTLSAGAGSTTITNTTSAAGLVVGGSGSFGIGTNLSSVAGGTNQFWVAASPPNEKYTNLFGNTDEISGAYRVLTVGTNVGNNVQISDGISSFPNGMWIDAGAQEYFVGKISVGTERGQFQLGSGAVSNLTATGVIYAPSNNITGGISAGSISATTLNIATAYVTNLTSGSQSNGFMYAQVGGLVVATNNGVGLTNIQLQSIVSTTNVYGATVTADFSYTESTTNMAGDLTFTGVSNWSATGYNHLILHCLANGANRTITPVASWQKSRSAFVITNGTKADIHISMQFGVFTNISQVDFF